MQTVPVDKDQVAFHDRDLARISDYIAGELKYIRDTLLLNDPDQCDLYLARCRVNNCMEKLVEVSRIVNICEPYGNEDC